MSDYSPNPGGYDKYGNSRFDPPEPGGRGPYVLLAILVVIGLVGGLLYFGGAPKDGEVARAPADRPATTTPGAPGGAPGGGGMAPADRTTPSPTQRQ